MSDYTLIDVIQFINNSTTILSNRKKINIDPRNYLLNILYYKFKLIEEEVATILGIHRSSASVSKNNAYDDWENEEFLGNTEEVRELFPWIPPNPEEVKVLLTYARTHKVILNFTNTEYIELLGRKKKQKELSLSMMIRRQILTNGSKDRSTIAGH